MDVRLVVGAMWFNPWTRHFKITVYRQTPTKIRMIDGLASVPPTAKQVRKFIQRAKKRLSKQ